MFKPTHYTNSQKQLALLPLAPLWLASLVSLHLWSAMPLTAAPGLALGSGVNIFTAEGHRPPDTTTGDQQPFALAAESAVPCGICCSASSLVVSRQEPGTAWDSLYL